jgi:hypothetical protein
MQDQSIKWINHAEIRVSYSGGIYPRHEFDMGGISPPPHQLEVFFNSVILRHLEAELLFRLLKNNF